MMWIILCAQTAILIGIVLVAFKVLELSDRLFKIEVQVEIANDHVKIFDMAIKNFNEQKNETFRENMELRTKVGNAQRALKGESEGGHE